VGNIRSIEIVSLPQMAESGCRFKKLRDGVMSFFEMFIPMNAVTKGFRRYFQQTELTKCAPTGSAVPPDNSALNAPVGDSLGV
jgi:hypothetical protein